MLRTNLLSIIRSLNTVYRAIGICHASYVDSLLADIQHNYYDIYHCCVYSNDSPDDGQ
jgi:uncharacterized protein (DUF4213/DUF364 family)